MFPYLAYVTAMQLTVLDDFILIKVNIWNKALDVIQNKNVAKGFPVCVCFVNSLYTVHIEFGISWEAQY